ncbi:39S ribosomal protein L33, mitochondrial [Friedmanniomyces endolithicus]|nr:39S ribosomal protein L33, mitochondrial [Friedmanniomyces endolithicus]
MPPPTRFFRITLLRSAIGLPARSTGVLKSLGLHRRLKTVFAVKALVDVQEVDRALSDREMKELRQPDSGFYVERRAGTKEAVEEAA